MNKLFIITLATFTIVITASEKKGVMVAVQSTAEQAPVAGYKMQKSRTQGLIYVPVTTQLVTLNDETDLALPEDKFPDVAAAEDFKARIRRALRDNRVLRCLDFAYAVIGAGVAHAGYRASLDQFIYCVGNDAGALVKLLALDFFKLTSHPQDHVDEYVLECLYNGRKYEYSQPRGHCLSARAVSYSPFTGRKLNLSSQNPRVISGEISDDDSDAPPAYAQAEQ